MITHEYNYEDVLAEPDKVDHRRWVTKRTPEQIPMSKVSGRKDNSNKEPETYFDKHDIIKILTRNNPSMNWAGLNLLKAVEEYGLTILNSKEAKDQRTHIDRSL